MLFALDDVIHVRRLRHINDDVAEWAMSSFDNLKWAQGCQGRQQRESNFTDEMQLIFSHVKYNFIYF